MTFQAQPKSEKDFRRKYALANEYLVTTFYLELLRKQLVEPLGPTANNKKKTIN
jgi:hypothetical protein